VIAPPLVLVLLLAAAPEPAPATAADPAELVSKLGAPSFADREQATAGLRDLGDAALPALRVALRDKDAEVRARAAALAAEIETARMLRATPITLNYTDRPLAEVLKDFGTQAGAEVVLQPMGFPNPAQARRVTLDVPGTLPFWTAVDKLCAATQLQHNPFQYWGQFVGRPSFPLSQGSGTMQGRVADGGPFRVILQSLAHTRTVAPVPPGAAEPPVGDMFVAQMFVTSEPRLQLFQMGPAKLAEAADDLGQSLAIPESPSAGTTQEMYVHNNGARGFSVQTILKYPGRPGNRIKILRGGVPVILTTQKADPLEVRLAEATGKTFKVDGGTLVIKKAEANGPGPVLEAELQPQGTPEAGPNPGHQNFILAQTCVEIVDAQDRPVRVYVGGGFSSNNQVHLMVTRANNAADVGPPDRFRYHGLNRTTATAAFEFTDLPMP